MPQWAEIRHLHLVDGVPKEIARRLKLDVKTVRRAIGRPTTPVRVSVPRASTLDPQQERITQWAARGAEADREARSPVVAAVGGAGPRAHGAPLRRGAEDGRGTEGRLRAPQPCAPAQDRPACTPPKTLRLPAPTKRPRPHTSTARLTPSPQELAHATLADTHKAHLAELTRVPLLIIDDLAMRELPHTAAGPPRGRPAPARRPANNRAWSAH